MIIKTNRQLISCHFMKNENENENENKNEDSKPQDEGFLIDCID